MEHNFFATISRMKYIERWSLMRNSRPENISEHSLEVGMIAHALAVIGNVRYGKNLNTEQAALMGMYHDASEIITGDMPTPIKYFNDNIKNAFKSIEGIAVDRLLQQLPEDLRPAYADILHENSEDKYLLKLIKAADKLSALIKCIEEENSGNTEFKTARESTEKIIEDMRREYPEVDDFVREFIPSYGKTLDELNR